MLDTRYWMLDKKPPTLENDIAIVHFKHGERKDDVATKMRRNRHIDNGVVFIGIAQEKAYAFKGSLENGSYKLFTFIQHPGASIQHRPISCKIVFQKLDINFKISAYIGT